MIKFDPNHIVDYTGSAERATIQYRKNNHEGDYRLWYVGCDHKKVGIHGETSRAIEEAIIAYKEALGSSPGYIVVEWGFRGISPPAIAAKAKEIVEANPEHAPDGICAVYLADKHGLPFISGEPPFAEVFARMEKEHGYSANEMLFFYLLRKIPQWRHEDKPENAADFPDLAEEFLANIASAAGIAVESVPKLDEFRKWFSEHRPESCENYMNICTDDRDDLGPFRDGHYLQKMAHRDGLIREANILSVIAAGLNQHHNVIVAYGNDHLTVSRKVFETALGRGEILSPKVHRGIAVPQNEEIDLPEPHRSNRHSAAAPVLESNRLTN